MILSLNFFLPPVPASSESSALVPVPVVPTPEVLVVVLLAGGVEGRALFASAWWIGEPDCVSVVGGPEAEVVGMELGTAESVVG